MPHMNNVVSSLVLSVQLRYLSFKLEKCRNLKHEDEKKKMARIERMKLKESKTKRFFQTQS